MTRQNEENWVVSADARPVGVCPDCGTRSSFRHGRRSRQLADLPIQGQAVKVRLTITRWQCRHRKCVRRTFSDQLPTIAPPYAHRTSRMAEIVGLLGHGLGGRPAESLMQRLGMPVSDDTILRQLKRNAPRSAEDGNIRILGIDDWSWRRSSHYGTIMVDLEQRSVVDILDDRSVESVRAWLQERPSIEVVSRDRCGLYAQAAREGAPQARQVADRFHLVQNLQAAIKAQMSLYDHGNVRPILSEDAIASARSQRHFARLAHRQSRKEIFNELHALRQCGLSYSEIGRRTGYDRRSIANWLSSSAPRDRNRAALKPTSPLHFEKFLAECWKNGNRNGRHLFNDVRNQGYTGSRSNLERLLKEWRNTSSSQPDIAPREIHVSEPVRDPDTGHMISSMVAAALCIKPRGKLTVRQVRKVDALKQGSTPFAEMRALAMRFRGILRAKNPDQIEPWIDDAIDTELAEMVRFARVLHRDLEAVKNAIELPWNNGQAEGQINRLKTLKRAMYGRAGPELMRARMLPLSHTL
ncbi:MAG: ISL3 family transposase [Phycisphaerales bacterium]|nr:ISL3 family transposase [Phycisphaerales bacterium]